MATVLDKELKRRIIVNGAEYTVVLGPEGLRVLGKGKRRPEIELRWIELLSGEAAMAVALNASLSGTQRPVSATQKPPPEAQPADRTSPPPAKKRSR